MNVNSNLEKLTINLMNLFLEGSPPMVNNIVLSLHPSQSLVSLVKYSVKVPFVAEVLVVWIPVREITSSLTNHELVMITW